MIRSGHLIHAIVMHEIKLIRSTGNHLSANLFFLVLYNLIFSFFLNSVLWNSSLLEIVIYMLGVLITYIMSIERYFAHSMTSGMIEFYLMLDKVVLSVVFLVRCILHWIIYGVTTAIISLPVFLFLYNTPTSTCYVIIISITSFSLLLSLLGGCLYNLAIRLPYKGSILSVILFPSYLPILLISISTIESAVNKTLHITSTIQLWISACLFCSILGCYMTYYALKYSIDY